MLNLGISHQFFGLYDLEIWWMTSKINRAPLLCHCKLCASFHNHMCIHTGVTIQKCPNWDKICFDLCDLDHWPLTLTFCMDIILSMVITPENFIMTQWQEHIELQVIPSLLSLEPDWMITFQAEDRWPLDYELITFWWIESQATNHQWTLYLLILVEWVPGH